MVITLPAEIAQNPINHRMIVLIHHTLLGSARTGNCPRFHLGKVTKYPRSCSVRIMSIITDLPHPNRFEVSKSMLADTFMNHHPHWGVVSLSRSFAYFFSFSYNPHYFHADIRDVISHQTESLILLA